MNPEERILLKHINYHGYITGEEARGYGIPNIDTIVTQINQHFPEQAIHCKNDSTYTPDWSSRLQFFRHEIEEAGKLSIGDYYSKLLSLALNIIDLLAEKESLQIPDVKTNRE